MAFSTKCKMAWGSTVSFFEKSFDKPKDVMVAYEVIPAQGSKKGGRPRMNNEPPACAGNQQVHGEDWELGMEANYYPPQMIEPGYNQYMQGPYPPQY